LSSVRSNFAANLLGQVWVAGIQLLVVPIYLHLLGVEAYGLIGFFVALQTTLQVLDMGLGQTLAREIARRRGSVEEQSTRSLVVTIGGIYFVLGIAIGLCVVFAAPMFASGVIRSEQLGAKTVEEAIRLMGLLVPVLWGSSLFQSALMGAERQVHANVIRISMASLGALGAVLILLFVSPTITAFFSWQFAIGVVSCAISGVAVHRMLPKTPSRFSLSLLKGVWRFAAGISGIAIGGIILAQLDKWLLINLLPLETYGYYTLAVVAANALYLFITPLYSSLYPRLTALCAGNNTDGARKLYHTGSQYMAALVLPVAAVISIFSRDILVLWTRDASIARVSAPIVSILIIGTALNGLMNMPYALQLAAGRTGLALRLVLMKLALFIPGIIILTVHFGITGAAWAWLLLNALYVVVGVRLTHLYLLKGESQIWFLKDVLPPAIASFVVCGFAFTIQPTGMGDMVWTFFLGVTTLGAVATAAFSVPKPRSWMIEQIRRVFRLQERQTR
jgi:O-antigen/teichoic acid export membrane protein